MQRPVAITKIYKTPESKHNGVDSLHTPVSILLSITLSHFYRQTYSVSRSSKESSRVINKQPQLKLTDQSHQIWKV